MTIIPVVERRQVSMPALIALRTAQYGVVVPLVLALAVIAIMAMWVPRLGKVAAEMGCLGLVLLFVPIFGWIMLGFMWLATSSSRAAGRRARRENDSAIFAEIGAKIAPAFRPWCTLRSRPPRT